MKLLQKRLTVPKDVRVHFSLPMDSGSVSLLEEKFARSQLAVRRCRISPTRHLNAAVRGERTAISISRPQTSVASGECRMEVAQRARLLRRIFRMGRSAIVGRM